MAILNITSGATSDLSVVKVTPVSYDCFTQYEYIVTTNPGDSISITLAGNHYEAKYIDAGGENNFSDSTSTVYNSYLSIQFLLLNSGTTGVYSNATLTVTNLTTSNYYQNLVERSNDTANCYDSGVIPTKTSELLNDGSDGIGQYVTTNTTQTVTGTKTFTASTTFNSDIYMTNGVLQVNGGIQLEENPSGHVTPIFFDNETTPSAKWAYNYATPFQGGIFMENGNIAWRKQAMNIGAILANTNTGVRTYTLQDRNGTLAMLDDIAGGAASDVVFTPYLTLGSTNVQAAINELKDEVDLLGATTIDSAITDGSTNPVENNAIFDALALKANLAGPQTFTGNHTFTGQVTLDNGSADWGIYQAGSLNYMALYNSGLRLQTAAQPNAWIFDTTGNLSASSGVTLHAPKLTTADDAYSSGWDGSTQVPTKNAVYDKIESLVVGGGSVNISGTPVDNQIATWTNANTIEGVSGLTYDGTALNITGNITLSGTVDGIDIATDVAANTAKVTNATHTGDVTGDTVLTIASGAVDIAHLSAGGTASSATFLRGDNTWATPAGSGDVSKVGSPVNDQIGVWTGDGTIEGDSDLTFDGFNLTVGGGITAGGTITSGGNTVWHAGNDGSGSGLDADLLKGLGITAIGSRFNVISTIGAGGQLEIGNIIDFHGASSSAVDYDARIRYYDDTRLDFEGINNTGLKVNNNTVWHAGNDGPGTGLDADTLDGIQATGFLTSDKYAEGTFTPTFVPTTSGSYTSTRTGNYIKVGKLVHFSISIVVTAASSPVGILNIGSMPFPIAYSYTIFPVEISGAGLNFATFYSIHAAATANGSLTLWLKQQRDKDTQNDTVVAAPAYTGGSTTVKISGTYITT